MLSGTSEIKPSGIYTLMISSGLTYSVIYSSYFPLFVSFSLISNTVRLSVYARRFVIHTMKLVGASWGFIRKPFLKQAIWIGVIAAILAIGVLGVCVYGLFLTQPGIEDVVTWQVLAITAAAVLMFGIVITALCAWLAVNKFLKMTAGELYKI